MADDVGGSAAAEELPNAGTDWIEVADGSFNFAAILAAVPTEAAAAGDEWPSYRGGPWHGGLSRSGMPAKLQRKWTYQHEGKVISTAAIADGVVYVTTEDGTLLALRLEDGERLWSYAMEAECGSAPLISGSLVVAGDDNGVLHGVDRVTGESRWRVNRGSTLCTSQGAGEFVLTGGYDHELQAVRGVDGEAGWSWTSKEPVVSPATVMGDLLAVGGCDGKVHIVSLADGLKRAEIGLGSQVGAAMPWDGQGLYAVTIDGVISRLERAGEDGQVWRVAWRMDFSKPGAVNVSQHAPQTAALAGDRLVAGFSDGWVRCFRITDGRRYWERKPGGELRGSAVIADGRVLLGDEEGTLLMLSLADGVTLWKDVVGGQLVASPAVAAGRVIIGSTSGIIVCYGE